MNEWSPIKVLAAKRVITQTCTNLKLPPGTPAEIAGVVLQQKETLANLFPDQPPNSENMTAAQIREYSNANFRERIERLEAFVKQLADSVQARYTTAWAGQRCTYRARDTVSCHSGQRCRNSWITLTPDPGSVFDRKTLRTNSTVKDPSFRSDGSYRFRAGKVGSEESTADVSIQARLTDSEVERRVGRQMNAIRRALLNNGLPIDGPINPEFDSAPAGPAAPPMRRPPAPASPAVLSGHIVVSPADSRIAVVIVSNSGGSRGTYHFQACYRDGQSGNWRIGMTTAGGPGWLVNPGGTLREQVLQRYATEWKLRRLDQNCAS